MLPGKQVVAEPGSICKAAGSEEASMPAIRLLLFDTTFHLSKHHASYMPSKETRMKFASFVFVLSVAVTLCAVAIARAVQNPQLSVDPVILSDTHGYNFEKYLGALIQQVRMKWYTVMPDSARQGQKGRVVLIFTVLRDGTIKDLRIVSKSGTESLDQATTVAVQSASPFSQLPGDFSDNRIIVQFTFLYNQR